jgi:hypothetical protein
MDQSQLTPDRLLFGRNRCRSYLTMSSLQLHALSTMVDLGVCRGTDNFCLNFGRRLQCLIIWNLRWVVKKQGTTEIPKYSLKEELASIGEHIGEDVDKPSSSPHSPSVSPYFLSSIEVGLHLDIRMSTPSCYTWECESRTSIYGLRWWGGVLIG